MTPAISYNDGVLDIRNTAAAIEVLEFGLRTVADPTLRRGYLSLATAISKWKYNDVEHLLVPPIDGNLAESFAVLWLMRTIVENDGSFLAVVNLYAGFPDLRTSDMAAAMLYEPRTDFLLRLLRAPAPLRRLRAAVVRRLNRQLAADDDVIDDVLAEPALESGIDVDGYLAGLGSRGVPGDALAAIGDWLNGMSKATMGDARYQRALYWLKHPLSREIAEQMRRTEQPRQSTWFTTVSGHPDTVWHTANRSLLEK